MAGMRDMLLWLKQQQEKPEWKAANQYQNRNQTPIIEKPKAQPMKDIEVIDETPKDSD